jgi:hypothetical protein
VVTVVGTALAFGVLAALIKGHGYGVRDTVGNLSTPWLLVAFAAGLQTRSARRGAVLGLAATVTALLGFYLAVAVTTDDQLPTLGEHLAHVLRENRRWLFSGLVSGPVVGAFGAWVRQRARDVATAVAVVTGLLLVAEPFVIVAARLVPGWRQVVHWTLDPGPYLAEAVLGVLILVITWRRGRCPDTPVPGSREPIPPGRGRGPRWCSRSRPDRPGAGSAR